MSPLAALLLCWHGAKYTRSQQNALKSDSLCLRPEISEMIVSYVLGANGTVIHIKYVDVDSVDSYTGADRLPPPLGFHRAGCQSGKTEHAAYAEANCKAVVCIVSRDRGIMSREALDATSTAPALIRLASMLTQKASIMRSLPAASDCITQKTPLCMPENPCLSTTRYLLANSWLNWT